MIFYLAHPVGPAPGEVDSVISDWRRAEEAVGPALPPGTDVAEHAARLIVRTNVDRALAWLRFLVDHTEWSISAPWIAYCQALDDTVPAHRARGIRDSQAMARGADGIILAGGRTSTGMQGDHEAVRAARPDHLAIELHDLGVRPPVLPGGPPSDFWRQEMQRRFDNAVWRRTLTT